jgi:hypothetical protein
LLPIQGKGADSWLTQTFLTTLYVMIDDFCKLELSLKIRPGSKAYLGRSEAVTLAILRQWARFGSGLAFHRFARSCLRGAFPTLPSRSQFNRLPRRERGAVVAAFLHLAEILEARQCLCP